MSSFNGFELAFRSMTARVAAELKVSNMFSVGMHGDTLAFTLDAIAHSGHPERGEVNGIAYERRWGVGIRVALRMTEIKAAAAFTFAGVAAQAELGKANVFYHVVGLGLDDATIAALLDVPIQASFGAATFVAIQAAFDAVADHLSTPGLVPHEYSVPQVPSVKSPVNHARTINYAMSKLSQQESLAEALRSAKPHGDLDGTGIAVIYSRMGGEDGFDDAGKPKPEVIARARKWLTTGT